MERHSLDRMAFETYCDCGGYRNPRVWRDVAYQLGIDPRTAKARVQRFALRDRAEQKNRESE